jgi:Concanavalin A-like lectin/glucanases superfamily
MSAIRHRLKPALPQLNRQHPLAAQLTHFWTMHEGSGLVLQNVGTAGPSGDILLASNTEQSWLKEDQTAVSPGISANATSGGNHGSPRAGLNFGTKYTIQCRIQPRGQTDVFGRLLGAGNQQGTYQKSSGKFSFYTNLGDQLSTTTMNNTSSNRTWYDWIVSYEYLVSGTIYLNGVQDATFTANYGSNWAPDSMFNNSSSETYVGLVDFMRVWTDRALNAQEAEEAATDPYAVLQPAKKWYAFAASSTGARPRVQMFIF